MLGTVSHRLLEEAGRGLLGAAPATVIGERWDELLRIEESEATHDWLQRHFVPLSSSVADFEVRRLQAIGAATALAAAASQTAPEVRSARERTLGAEVPVSTPDGEAGGRIDVVVDAPGGPVLKDYKTGAVLDPARPEPNAVKPAYATQLKLYAAIYAAMTGKWPSELQLVPVAGNPVAIPFTRDECRELLQAAVELRRATNEIVASSSSLEKRMERLADPAPAECVHCAYRPYCAPYAMATHHEPARRWPADAQGVLKDRVELGNGRLLLAVETSAGEVIQIRGVDPRRDRHPALDGIVPGQRLGAFNLRPDGSETSFSEGAFTTFYRMSAGVAES
jgi:hypothetical protein